jgi:hypothetical protein
MFYCGYDPGYEVYLTSKPAGEPMDEQAVSRGYWIGVAALLGLLAIATSLLGLQ